MDNIGTELLNSFRAPAVKDSYFLSFEGIEGAGKSTQITKVREYLESKNYRVLLLREPGGTAFGEKLRSVILENKSDLTALAEAHLFASSRAQLLNEVILKELETPNTIVICDRYIDSSIAYQGLARGLGIKAVLDIHNIYPLNVVPHKTFYLRISAETSEKRQLIRNAPKDYFESKGMDFYKKLVEGYDLTHELFPKRVVRLDASGEQEEVTKLILKELDGLLKI